jgi:hypothetical protein
MNFIRVVTLPIMSKSQLTPHQNIELISPYPGFEAASWADTVPPPNRPQSKKYVWAGSKTIRPYSGPWYLYCRYEINGRVVGHSYNLGSQHGDGDIVQWLLGSRRGVTRTHYVEGAHAFEYPPGNAIIVTKAYLVDSR